MLGRAAEGQVDVEVRIDVLDHRDIGGSVVHAFGPQPTEDQPVQTRVQVLQVFGGARRCGGMV